MPFVSYRHTRLTLALTGLGLVLAFTVLALPAMAAPAAKPDLTPPKLSLDAFLAQSTALHPNSPQAPGALTAQAPKKSDSEIATAMTPAPTLSKLDADAVNSILKLTAGGSPKLETAGIARGMAVGQGNLPVIPAMMELDHATAEAVVVAFHKPAGVTAEDQAMVAATAAADPVFTERLNLVRTLYRVDGTDALVRHIIATEHMKLIITEVNNHIEIAKLSESDKYRLAAIAAAAQTELEDKVLNMSARMQADNLTKPEILQLITAFDNDAQRKITGIRLNDTGKLDQSIDLDIRIAQYQIVKSYETAQ